MELRGTSLEVLKLKKTANQNLIYWQYVCICSDLDFSTALLVFMEKNMDNKTGL